MLVATLCSVAIISCKDDDSDPVVTVDLAALNASIAAAEAKLASTEEGKNDGQYPAAARTTLSTAIAAAKTVAAASATTQVMADNAKVSLDAAVTAYDAAKITPIAAEALVAHWSFDEGTGTTAHDESANGFDGTFVAGPKWTDTTGLGMPEWTIDRSGVAGKAIRFDSTKGGSVEIPYNAKLNPTSAMTISVWLKADKIDANNRFLGLQSWVGYKFQLQEANRPFLSVGHGEDATYDKDSEQNLPIREWHHVVATFGGGHIIFYVDGVMVKDWEGITDPARSISSKPYNLVIGQDFPTDKYVPGEPCWSCFSDPNDPNYRVIPLQGGGYFKGSLDELRIYNVALTESQVGSLYDREKP